MSGILPLFLGELADEHRLTAAGVGELATLELLSAAVFTGLAGALLRPRHLRTIAVLASLALAAGDLATSGLSGGALMAMRAACGAPEGVLLWLVVGLVARTRSPNRISGILFTAMAGVQLAVAVLLALIVMPHRGANGAYQVVAGLSALGAIIALGLPSRYGAPPAGAEGGGAPPIRGWLALGAVFIFQAAISAAGVYILPLAHQAGLSDGVGQTAVSVALALEVLGALAATCVSERAKFLDVFLIGGAALSAAFAVYAVDAPAWLFVGASGMVGFFSLLVMPFFVSLTIKADPSRRAAVQLGAAQLLGGALGPVLASVFVRGEEVRSPLIVSGVLLGISLATIFYLNRPLRSPQARTVQGPRRTETDPSVTRLAA